MLQMTDKQKEFWRGATCRWNVKAGATRSGKTYLDYYMIPRRIRACQSEGLIMLIGNTISTLKRNILDPMREIWGKELVPETVSSDNTIKLFGKKCYVLGADKVSQVSKLQGAGIEYCYGDEVTTWHEDVFNMLKSRLSCQHSLFDGTCNPDNPRHWFKFFLDSDSDVFRQDYTIYDNQFLSPEFVKNLEKEYAGSVYYKRFILGQWAIAEGLVYANFGDGNITNTIPPSGRYYISVDYGTRNPFSAGLWCVTDNEAVRIREFYYNGREHSHQMTDEDYHKAIDDLAAGLPIEYIIIDPSAASMIATIRRHGKYYVKSGANNVLDGIRVTNSLLNCGKVKIHESCKDAINEFYSYAWDDKATEDKVIKDNDHAMDDVRYFCNTILAREFKWCDWTVET